MSNLSELIRQRFGLQDGELQLGCARIDEINTTITDLLGRRSIRRYTDEPISDDMLDTLLACAQSAPTKSNLQQYSIVVVSDESLRKRLAEHCPKTPQLQSCPVFLVFCADIRRNQRVADVRNHTYANNNLDCFVNAVIDAAMALQCLITAAESMGLGCAAISEIRDGMEAVSALLELPPGVFPISGLTLGKPAVRGFINQRLAPNIVVHRDRYDDSHLEADIETYDARRHAIFPIPDSAQMHTDKYGTACDYTWSENTARQLSIPERQAFRAFLKTHGFDLN
tara:strand:- start:2547 stop:3395 length:849 start_codon:yes stop_codon:yes gene_type:complete